MHASSKNGSCYSVLADWLPCGGPVQPDCPICFQRVRNTDFSMNLPNFVVHLDDYITGLHTTSFLVISTGLEKNKLNFFI